MIAESDLARKAGGSDLSGLFVIDVLKLFGVTYCELRGRRRGTVTLARWALAYLHREYLGWSYERIGDLMGKRHDTVLYGYTQACILLHERIEPFTSALAHLEKKYDL